MTHIIDRAHTQTPGPLPTRSVRPVSIGRMLKLARRGQHVQRGVTLVEVLIVVAIMAMLAGGVAVFALPKYREAQVSTAATSARTIRTAVQDWQRVNNEYSCPSVSQLKQEKIIDTAAETNDPWNEPFALTCSDDEVYVASKGPDKKDGTQDDIMIPKALTNEEQ